MSVSASGLGPAAAPIQVVTKPIGPVCNLACAYCFYLDKKHLYPGSERFRMTRALLDSYVRRSIEAQPGPSVEFLWQGGEPTLMGVDFFRTAVDLQRRYLPEGWDCRNSLQTNGTLLDAEWCEFLSENRFLVGISIDGPAALHDHFRVDRAGRTTHAAVMRGLRLLREHGVEHNVLCAVNAVNARRPLEVYRFLRDEGAEWIQLIPIVERVNGGSGVSGADVSERSVTGEAYGEFLVAVFDEWVRHDVGRVFVQMFEECFRVVAGYPATLCVLAETCGNGLAMEHDGDVFSCDHFVDPQHRLGNIADTPLRVLADLPAQRRFGLDKRDTLPERCLTCDVRHLCNGGCPKDRLLAPPGPGTLNHLCTGYRRFFRHAEPVVRRMVALYRSGVRPAVIMGVLAEEDAARFRHAGRNDPCPCGSGEKFKRCCGNPARQDPVCAETPP